MAQTVDIPQGKPVPSQRSTPAGPRNSLWALRIVATLLALATVAQPVMAGLYLSGNVDALRVHAINALVLLLFSVILFLVSLFYVLGGRGRWRVSVWPVLAFVLGFVQMVAGYTHGLALHIPLGVTVVVANVLFAIWTFTAAARRRRPTRARKVPS